MTTFDDSVSWKPIVGYTDYEVSPHPHFLNGRMYQVRNVNFKVDGMFRPVYGSKDKDGYIKLCLNNYQGESKQLRLNRIVASCFIKNDNPKNNIVVNHINEIKDDNDVSNLEWCTVKYNSNYGTLSERKRKTNIKSGNYNPTSAMNIKTNKIINFETITDCAKFIGAAVPNIIRSLSGDRISSKGYVFLEGNHTNPNDFYEMIKSYDNRSSHKTSNKEVIVDNMFVFSSKTSASKFVGCSPRTISRHLEIENNMVNGRYVVYFKEVRI